MDDSKSEVYRQIEDPFQASVTHCSYKNGFCSGNELKTSVFGRCGKFLQIHLHDWWLMQPQEGEGIAVGGFTIRREGFETYFCSASIKERHDSSTLESSDGFTIFIGGLINRSVTEQNGFPSKVCSRFLFGFPCNWHDFTSQHVGKGSTGAGSHTGSFDGNHTFQPGSFQDMPYLQKRDLLLSDHGLYEEDAINQHIFGDLLVKLKPAKTSSMVDITHECDLPRANKSKDLQEKGTHIRPNPSNNGVRTRRMTKMINAARDKDISNQMCQSRDSKCLVQALAAHNV